MTWWSVAVETAGAGGLAPEALDELLDLLAQHSASVGGGDRGYAARISVEAPDAYQARERGTRLIAGAANRVGIPGWPVVRLEVVRDDVLETELSEPPFPDVVGTREVGKLLGVSRQRLAEIRNNAALEFPVPIVVLAAGPIWLRAAVEVWLENWERKPGRPRSAHVSPPRHSSTRR